MDRGAWWATVHKVAKSWSKELDMTEETQYEGNPFNLSGVTLHAVQEKKKKKKKTKRVQWDMYPQGYFNLSYLAEKHLVSPKRIAYVGRTQIRKIQWCLVLS